MFWRGRFTSLMAVIMWIGIILFIGGLMAFANVWFLIRSWSDPMIYTGLMLAFGTFGIRIVAYFADLIMTVAGRPLFYDLQITDDLDIRQ